MRREDIYMCILAKGKRSEGLGGSIARALSRLDDNDELLGIAALTVDLGEGEQNFPVDDRSFQLPGAVVGFIELDLHRIGAQYAPHWES